MKLSIIVPTYNRPQALKLSLLSLAEQSLLPDEVLVADDGSTSETGELVKKMQGDLKKLFPLKHVWHEDRGFRKPMILNETVRQSTGDYLIFLDGDCMAHRHFVRSHVRYGGPDAIVSGKRVEIGKEMTEHILERGEVLNRLTPGLLWDALRSRSRKVEEAFMLTNPLLRKFAHRDRITDDGVWGCNFSISRELFMAINGCDEDFLDGSIEDNDLGIRVLNQGKQVRSVRGLAIIFHLWHKSSWDFSNEKYLFNRAVLKRRIENKEAFCRNGICRR